MLRVFAYPFGRLSVRALLWGFVWFGGCGATAAHASAGAADSTALTARDRRRIEKAEAKAQRLAEKRRMRQDLTIDQRKQLNERVKEMDGIAVGQHVRISGGAKGSPFDPETDSLFRRGRYIRTTLRPDSALIRAAGFDSLPAFRTAADTLIASRFSDSLLVQYVTDSTLWKAPFRIAGLTYPEADSTQSGAAEGGKDGSGGLLSAEDSARLFKPRFRITQDTISAGRHTLFSAIAPGFGQIYNRQAWKLPILYGGVGGFLAGGFVFHNRYKTYKAEYDRAVELRLPPDIQRRARTQMRNAGSGQTLMFAMAGATYLYFVADAVFNYRGPVDPVRKATTLAAVFPGMGFVYTKTYWRLPIYYGGFIALATVIDYNNRNYQRYKTAYDALTDGNPSTVDEFGGRYSPEILSRVRSAYRRDRDLAIIGMAAAYLLSIVDTYVIASLKNWDVDENLSVRVEPTMIDSRFNGRPVSPAQGTAYGLALSFRF